MQSNPQGKKTFWWLPGDRGAGRCWKEGLQKDITLTVAMVSCVYTYSKLIKL